MSWYTVNLLFKATPSVAHDAESLWEERIVLINADGEEEVKEIAVRLGKQGEHSYPVKNSKGEENIINWTFERIERIHYIEEDTLISGTELFTRFLRDSEVKSILTPFPD